MKRPLLFVGLIALVAGLAAFFYTRRVAQPAQVAVPTPAPYSLPTVNSWNGIVPGASKTQDLVTKLVLRRRELAA